MIQRNICKCLNTLILEAMQKIQ